MGLRNDGHRMRGQQHCVKRCHETTRSLLGNKTEAPASVGTVGSGSTACGALDPETEHLVGEWDGRVAPEAHDGVSQVSMTTFPRELMATKPKHSLRASEYVREAQ